MVISIKKIHAQVLTLGGAGDKCIVRPPGKILGDISPPSPRDLTLKE